MAPDISVCFASRGRPASLAESVWGLIERAAEPDKIEVIIALDPDDDITIEKIEPAEGTEPDRDCRLPHQARTWIAPERYGYTRLHEYWNPIVRLAKGHWVMWWNDDARMETGNWDRHITSQPDAVLWPQANHVPWAMLFPAIPRAWTEAAGCASPATEMDTFWQRVGERLGLLMKIPVFVTHDRFDVTGNHNDQTYQEGRARFGAAGMVGERFPIELVAEFASAIEDYRRGA